jgi:hypothetical protein
VALHRFSNAASHLIAPKFDEGGDIFLIVAFPFDL